MMKWVGSFFFALISLNPSLWATQIPGAITLVNDAPYILTATVYTRSGDYLGQVTLQPGEQKNFTTNLSNTNLSRPGYPDVSITPYRIVWTCAGGGVYSMCQDGSSGAYVRASACPGLLYCSPKEEKMPPAAKPGGPTQKK
jgi:hypothetical protein